MSDEVVAERAPGAMRSTCGVERAAAMQHLPAVYSLALRLRAAGLADELIAECLAVEREALDPLWTWPRRSCRDNPRARPMRSFGRW
jgi:hypothetical protein